LHNITKNDPNLYLKHWHLTKKYVTLSPSLDLKCYIWINFQINYLLESKRGFKF